MSRDVPASELSLEEARELVLELRSRQSELEKTIGELQCTVEFKQAIIDSLPASVAVLDNNGVIISVNETWRNFGRQNGAKDERFSVGVNYFDVCQVAPPDADSADATAVASGLRDVMLGKCTEFQHEYPCHSPTEQRWFQAFVHSMTPPFQGSVVCHLNVSGWTREIAQRQLAEGALAASERELRLVINSIPGPVSRLDRDLRYTFANDQYEKHFGLSAEAVVGRTMVEVVGQERFERVQPYALRALAGEKVSFESKVRLVSGEVRTGLAHFLPEVDEQNNVLGFIVVGIDITERKAAEKALNERTAFLEALVDSSIDGILVVDGEKQKVLQNGRISTIWKIPQEIADDPDDARQVAYVTAHTKNPKEFADKIAHLYSHPLEVSRDEIELIEGTILDRYSAPVVDKEGNYYGRIWTFHDITDLRQAEEERNRLEAQLRQAQRLESIGKLAGGVAHDFNNMLGVIIGHTELSLLQLQPDAKVYSNLEQIQKAAIRSAELTRQLLAFARKQPVEPRPLDLNVKVSRILSLIARLIGEDISIQWKPSDQLWLVKMDKSQIEQILTNLCVNARDAINGVGYIVIETANYTVTDADCVRWVDAVPGDYVKLSVTDTGTGMDAKTMSRIFEPFFTTKLEGRGTGLGLATVYGAVRQNNGFITVTSELNRGSTFNIFLPRFIGTKEGYQKAQSVTKAPMGHETILVVEDEAVLLELTCTILQMHGYNVLAAATPAEAQRLAVNNADKISLLITDVIMPEMNGRDLADQIQQICPNLKRLYISGYTDDVIAQSGALETGTQFLQKPFTPSILASKLREVLDHPAP